MHLPGELRVADCQRVEASSQLVSTQIIDCLVKSTGQYTGGGNEMVGIHKNSLSWVAKIVCFIVGSRKYTVKQSNTDKN